MLILISSLAVQVKYEFTFKLMLLFQKWAQKCQKLMTQVVVLIQTVIQRLVFFVTLKCYDNISDYSTVTLMNMKQRF